MRHPDWVARLNAVAEQWKDVPMQYGVNDCGRMAATCVDAVLGTDHLSKLTYTNGREALMFVNQHGGLIEYVSSILGYAKQGRPVRRGDIGMVSRHALCVCFGPQTLAMTVRGMQPVDRRVVQFWHWEVD